MKYITKKREEVIKISCDLLKLRLYSVEYYRYLYYVRLKRAINKGQSKKIAAINSLNAIIEIYRKTKGSANYPTNFKKYLGI
jgi:hypothetical protein